VRTSTVGYVGGLLFVSEWREPGDPTLLYMERPRDAERASAR
jgi:hypothetical protein